MKIKLILVAFFLTITTTILAKYSMGPPEYYLSRNVVIDATIQEFTKEGYAKLKVNELIIGKEAPTLLKYVSLTCCGPAPVSGTGMKKGKRYIIVTSKDNLYEWSTYWEVLKSFDGELKCYYTGRSKPSKKFTVKMPQEGLYKLSEFKEKIKAVVAGTRKK